MNLDLSKIKKVFFVGIGGIGISAIARIMFLEGKEVSGSDMAVSEVTHELEEFGVKIIIGQGFELIPLDADLIVYTIAIGHYDPNLFEQIKNSGIIYKSYPEMLHYVTNNKYTIAISGTHGKTTTTAMIGKMLVDVGKDPSIIVGSILREYKSNLVIGKSEYFVVEACEYERSFLNINPTTLVITNVEPDHLDYYKDIRDIENAFSELVDQTKSIVICNQNDPVIKEVLIGRNITVVDYIKYLGKVPKLSVPGIHNRMNAACALAVAGIIGIEDTIAGEALANFQGTWRRLEKRGVTDTGVIIYDDYAHHPTEVRASLQALRELYPKGEKRIVVIFQPHLYSRTKALFDEFVTCFDQADQVYLLPIYFAREAPDPEISSEKLAGAIKEHGVDVTAFEDFKEAEEAIKALNLGPNDIFVTMGAGEAYKVADHVFIF
ncbi:MAG: UDP-N-acetylmuramate-L-alanine ligase [Candidatus Nomurabacteria bacterium GW2011_GWA2_40_9]|uniref:UDP-N-acetylmuramate--L-alanine ligase n=1 Tax=Candidatus Nomurabacteria bacterium GW2011_GWA2_40_9 TaxID=1618734 RepID=A0A0G0TX05_9BACT|nr:MAG: UDP-N-acetylmuramate-L-alanine ligase [Candidatus Nomurabacteria bacterium GW2011_GWA2_40_9]